MTDDQEEQFTEEIITANEIKKMWVGKLLNIDPNDELSEEDYFAALGKTRVYKALNIFTKIFSAEIIGLLLFFGILLIIVGSLIPPVQSLIHNIEQFARLTYSDNVTTENLRTIVHAIKELSKTLKEALHTASDFWDNA